ncbi:MAG: phosphoglucosamine mutase, partial [bacterium]
MSDLFGTDGIRGEANKYPLVPSKLMKIGQGLGAWYRENGPEGHEPVVILGHDGRQSSGLLVSAMTAGLSTA